MNSQIISGARSRDQASLVFKLAKNDQTVACIIKTSSYFSITENFNRFALQRRISRHISRRWDRAWFISAPNRSRWGWSDARSPHAFIEVIETSQGAQDDPLLIEISTQTDTDGDLFSIWLDDAEAADDKRIVSHLYWLRKIAKSWTEKRGK